MACAHTVPALLPQVRAHLPGDAPTAVAVLRTPDGTWLPARFSRFDERGAVLADGCYAVYCHGVVARRVTPALFRLMVARGEAKVVASQGSFVVRGVGRQPSEVAHA